LGRPKHVQFAPGTKGRVLVASAQLTEYQKVRINQFDHKGTSPPRRDDGSTDPSVVLAETPAGLLVAHARACLPLSVVFAPGSADYEAVMRGHEDRVRAELGRIEREEPTRNTPEEVFGKLPNNRRWNTLVVVNCRGCGLRLLGRQEEATREAAVRRRMRCSAHLPPPVNSVVGGFCFCSACTEERDADPDQEGWRAG
jgi:hypothetical protein